jgi:hypothetical protein
MLENHNASPDMTYEEFVQFITDEDELGGEYYKGLEVFVWYCQGWLSSSRKAS